MITPLDIQNKEFSKSVNGYKKDEVDEFLDLLTVDLEKVLSENAAQKAENSRLSSELQQYKGSEGAVLETLEAAKALMSDISASAEKRAEILLKNAELDAEIIQREARESVERLSEEIVILKNKFSAFQSKYRSLLETELERFDMLSVEIFGEFGLEEQLEEAAPKAGKKATAAAPSVKKDDLTRTMVNIRAGDGA
ncbi:MAG: DivIVA domain-containing protein [Clostridiales bacterium]|nr:DivIVA domain-containing protein [Clostridiales bacterium]